MAALSHGDEIDPIDGRMPLSRMVLDRSSDTHCEPRMPYGTPRCRKSGNPGSRRSIRPGPRLSLGRRNGPLFPGCAGRWAGRRGSIRRRRARTPGRRMRACAGRAPESPAPRHDVGRIGLVGLAGMDLEFLPAVGARQAVLPHDTANPAPADRFARPSQRRLHLARAVATAARLVDRQRVGLDGVGGFGAFTRERMEQQVERATPRISHCADTGQRPAFAAIAVAFVRISAPLVSKHRPPCAACGSRARVR